VAVNVSAEHTTSIFTTEMNANLDVSRFIKDTWEDQVTKNRRTALSDTRMFFLKIKVAIFSGTLITCHATRCHNPKDLNLNLTTVKNSNVVYSPLSEWW
jgi:hypothetical protein